VKGTEREHQVALFAWAKAKEGQYPLLALLYHCPNGGHRHPAVAGKMKAEGVKPGVPDVFLPVARKGYHGFFAEMKSDSGKLSIRQEFWRYHLLAQGYYWALFRDWKDAADSLEEYLK
jgi:hypothetical protein